NALGFAPKEGEIWVQKILEDAHNIKLGDYYNIGSEDGEALRVSAIVNDSIKPNSTKSGQSIYINKKDYEKFSNENYIDFITIKTSYSQEELDKLLSEKVLDGEKVYENISLEYIELNATMLNSMAGSLGTVTSVFMIIIIIVIIKFFIKSNINQEYSSIGTYKSLGFKNKEIMGFYFKCYLFIGIIALVVGVLLGLPFSMVLGRIAMKYCGEYSITLDSIMASLMVGLGVLGILLFGVFTSLRRIKQITPVDALRLGERSSREKIKKSLIKNAYSPVSMAINDIFKNKGRSVLTVIIIAVSFYISIMFLNMWHSFNTIEEKSSSWVGVPDGEGIIISNNGTIGKDILEYLDNDEYVKSYVYGNSFLSLDIEEKNRGISFKSGWKMSFNTYDKEKYGIVYTNGHAPLVLNEIGIGSKNLKGSKFKVGDYITLNIDGREETFLISGSFDTIHDGGIQFLNSYFNDDSLNISVSVKLKNPKDFDEFKERLEGDMNGYTVNTVEDVTGDTKNSILSIMGPLTMVIIIVFLMFTLLNILNLTMMNLNAQRRNHGIMKAYGFTTGYIIKKNLFKNLILSVVGLLISYGMNEVLTRKLFWGIFGCDGYNKSNTLTFLLIVVGVVLILFITFVLLLSIKRITPKDLIEE
ncbi:MAG: ABC transporter permease, partial [Clostridium sp.]